MTLRVTPDPVPTLPLCAGEWETECRSGAQGTPDGPGWWLVTASAYALPYGHGTDCEVGMMLLWARRKDTP